MTPHTRRVLQLQHKIAEQVAWTSGQAWSSSQAWDGEVLLTAYQLARLVACCESAPPRALEVLYKTLGLADD